MNLNQFLKYTTAEAPFVWCFSGSTYPITFFSLLWSKKNSFFGLPCVSLPYSKENPHELYNHLETLFLGQAHFYWLGDLSHLDAKLKKKIITYSTTYTGPHRFGFFIATDQTIATSESVQHVSLDTTFTLTTVSLLAAFFNYPALSPEFAA